MFGPIRRIDNQDMHSNTILMTGFRVSVFSGAGTRLLSLLLWLSVAGLAGAGAPAYAEGNDVGWLRPLVGTWQIDLPTGPAEIAIWERQTQTDAPSKSAFTIIHGIVRTPDGKCAFEFEEARNGLPTRYPRNQAPGEVHLRAYFGFRIIPEKWMTQFVSPSDPKPQWNPRDPSAGVKWAQRVDERKRACTNRINTFYLYPVKERGKEWVAETQSSLRDTDGASAFRMQKVSASPGMEKLIEVYKSQYADNASARARWPSERDFAAILDPALAPTPAPSRNSQCNQRRMAAAYRLAKETPYIKLEVRPVDGESVAVTQHRLRGDNSRAEKDVAYYPRQASIDWQALSLIGSSGGVPATVCTAADMLHAFLDGISAGTLASLDSATGDTKAPDTYNGLYWVDKHGVGRITISTAFGAQSYITRVFGSSSNFMPGERTHVVRETPASSKITLIPNIKDTVSGKVTSAAGLGVLDTARIEFDSTASEWLETNAYVGKIDPREAPVCAGWRSKPTRKECAQPVTNAERTQEVYLIEDEALAIKMFKNLSPDSRTWAQSLESDPCSSGPFCGPDGSRFLRAIYLGDDDSVREIEPTLIPTSTKVLQDYARRSGGDGNERITVLNHLIDEYMYDYQNHPEVCLNEGAQEMVFERKTNTIVLQNGLGQVVDEFGGAELYGRYLINEEFVEICTAYCDVREASIVGSLIGAIFEGPNYIREVRKMKAFSDGYQCNSAEMKQFESNFIEVFKNVHPERFKDRVPFQVSWY